MTKNLRAMALALALTAASLSGLPAPLLAADAAHRIVVHVNQNDPAVMNMVLNNIENLYGYYAAKNETVAIELVAHGPGLQIYVKDKSPVADRISTMALELPDLTFSACGNTLKGMNAKAGHDIPLISEATVVPSGAVRIVELQEQGYAYVRP